MKTLEQIEKHIDWCIWVGVLPRDYRKSTEYKEIVKQMRDDN